MFRGYPPPPHDCPYYWVILDPKWNQFYCEVMAKWPWRYRSRSKVITCHTSPHASDHSYQIWKESIQNCRRYRADTIFKVKAEWPWKYRSRSKVITCDTPSDTNNDLCQIWKECKQNCRFFFKVKAEKLEILAKNLNFLIFYKLNTQHTL